MLQLHFSFSFSNGLCQKIAFSFSKLLMLQFYFSLVSVTFKVNHYITFYNVLSTMLCCYCQFIQSGMQLLIILFSLN